MKKRIKNAMSLIAEDINMKEVLDHYMNEQKEWNILQNSKIWRNRNLDNDQEKQPGKDRSIPRQKEVIWSAGNRTSWCNAARKILKPGEESNRKFSRFNYWHIVSHQEYSNLKYRCPSLIFTKCHLRIHLPTRWNWKVISLAN